MPNLSESIQSTRTSYQTRTKPYQRETIRVCRVCSEIFPKVYHRQMLYTLTNYANLNSDLLLRHRQKIHDREKPSKQTRRPRSRSASGATANRQPPPAKSDTPPRPKRRRESISVAPLPPQAYSVSSNGQPANSVMYMPASAPPTTTNFSNFNTYPSPSSASPSSTTGAEFMDCNINTNYVNPADLFSPGPFTAPQNFAKSASISSSSSMIPPYTPPFSTYIPSFSASSKNINLFHRSSIDSSAFDMSHLMTPFSENTHRPPMPVETNMMLDARELSFSPPQLFDTTSPSSFTNDSGIHSGHSNSPFQFSWPPTNFSHVSDEYNTDLLFEPRDTSSSPMDILTKQESNLTASNQFMQGSFYNGQMSAAFPDGNDVFDLLIDEKDPSSYTGTEIIDNMLRGNLIASAQSAGVAAPQIPVAMDLSTYLSGYWEYIHPHAPIFFKPGFVARFVQEGILLGMCALGALTVSAKAHALALNTCAKAVIKNVQSSTERSDCSVTTMGFVI